MKISVSAALQQLAESRKPFTQLFSHGTLVVEIYQPVKEDLQKPHDRDEIYVIISGEGVFYCGDTGILFIPVIFSLCLPGMNTGSHNFQKILRPG